MLKSLHIAFYRLASVRPLMIVTLSVSFGSGAHAGFQPAASDDSNSQEPATTIEEKTKVHRLKSNKRSRFDAFVYVNRIPDRAEPGETSVDLAGRIFGRLANQEGRILLKVPPKMTGEAYQGFKTFLRSEGADNVGNCAACHTLPEFTDLKDHVVAPGGKPQPTPSLRNLKKSRAALKKRLAEIHPVATIAQHTSPDSIDSAFIQVKLTSTDLTHIAAFLETLVDVSDVEFRNLILGAKLLDTSAEIE